MTLRHFKAYLDDPTTLQVIMSKDLPHQNLSFRLESPDAITLHPWIAKEEEYDTNYALTLKLDQALDLTKDFDLYDNDRNHAPLIFRHILRDFHFDETFDARQYQLGAHFRPDQTNFRLWAPLSRSVWLKITKNDHTTTHALNKLSKGVWEITLAGDWEGAHYSYLHHVNGTWQNVHDPYAISSQANSGESYVVNPRQFLAVHPLLTSIPKEEAVIYEMSVRDFTSQSEAHFEHPSQFLGLVESHQLHGLPIGLDYLKALHISHVQLMPIFDFGSVDESQPRLLYNWGYDPVQYNVPEGSFASLPDDPYRRITELQTAVSHYHDAGIGVIMDVVYNHVYDIERYAFEKIVPGYVARVDKEGKRTNGSWCGNDVASERRMIRQYIKDSLIHWVKTYDIDGFRFDLMGLLDSQTMQEIAQELRAIKPNIYLYGEGWEMPTGLAPQALAHHNNAKQLPDYGFFNDTFRDTFKKVITQPSLLIEEDLHQVIENLLTGSIGNSQEPAKFLTANQSVNYLECHDNATFFDYIRLQRPSIHQKEQEHLARFGLQLQLLSQGMGFIHSGQEFFRTKNHIDNSYNSPDSINHLDWERASHHQETIAFFQKLIAFRRHHPLLALNTAKRIQIASQFYWITPYFLRYNLYEEHQDLEVVINFSTEKVTYHNHDKRQLLVHYPEVGNLGTQPIITLPPQSLIVLSKNT